MQLRVVFLLVASFIAYSQAEPKPILRHVLRGVGEVVGNVADMVTDVGESVGKVLGAVVGGDGDPSRGGKYSYYDREDSAATLGRLASSLEAIANRPHPPPPQIIINQHQTSDLGDDDDDDDE